MMDAKYGANYQIFALMCLTLTSLEINYTARMQTALAGT